MIVRRITGMLHTIRKLRKQIILLINRAKFHLFFKRVADKENCSNSKLISVLMSPARNMPIREYLAFIRCGAAHQVIDDGTERNFDIALNLYANYMDDRRSSYEYSIAGGINKFKAAHQFINDDLLARYKGFIFLDDDLEITYSALSDFLQYCTDNQLTLAQPSLTRDSHHSYDYLLNASNKGRRPVDMVEVMCPFFPAEALKSANRTFDLSYSTWGLGHIWPKLLKTMPVVVDEFTIRHTRPHRKDGSFYRYMREIGISPIQEKTRLKDIPLAKL
jgi:hypothetical protein